MKLKVLISVFVGASFAMANAVNGQRKYERGLYREAMALFENDFEKTKSEESFIMSLQSRLMLREFEGVLKKAQKPPKFQNKQWAMIYKIIYGKSIERFLSHYGHQLAQVEIRGATEPIKRTRVQWQADIRKIGAELVSEDQFLLSVNLDKVKPFFFFKDIDLEAMPTLYDWLVNEVTTNYYWGPSSETEKSALRGKATQGGGASRRYACDYWRLESVKAKYSLSEHFYFDSRREEPSSGESGNAYKKQLVELETVFNKNQTVRGKADALLAQAMVLGAMKDSSGAVNKCRQAIDLYKGKSTSRCLQIISQIEQKEVQIQKNRFNSKSDIKLPVYARNLKDLFVRVYQTENKNIDQNFESIRRGPENALNDDVIKKLIETKPMFTKALSIDSEHPHFFYESTLNIGKLPPGLFYVLISDADKIEYGKTFVLGAELRVTDIQLVYQLAGEFDPERSLGEKGVKTIPTHNFFVFDSQSGQLLNDIPMRTSVKSVDFKRATNREGACILNDTWNFQSANVQENQTSVKAVAQIKGSVSAFNNEYIVKPTFQHLKLVSELDRPIYRLGQRINLKAIVLRRVPFGYNVIPNASVKIRVHNPQYEVIAESTVDTNAQGALRWEYDLPMTGMLGNYQVQFEVDSKKNGFEVYSRYFGDSFKVEDYKRPDYYVEIEKAKDAWVFGKEVKIKISSKYYYGAPVKRGKVSYSITSENYFPWFYRDDFSKGAYMPPSQSESVPFTGQGVLDEKGELTVSYTPKANGSESRRFLVKASVRDESGRAIDNSEYFMASAKEFFIHVTTAKDFFKTTERPEFKIKLEAASGALFSSEMEYEVLEVLAPNDELKKKIKKESNTPKPYYGHRFDRDGVNFQKIFGPLSTQSLSKGKWIVTKDKSGFSLSALPEGVFKIKLTTKDSSGKRVISDLFFIVAESGKKLSSYYIPEITLLSKPEYKIGETMTILFGSSDYSGHMVGFLLKHQLKIDNPIFKTDHGIKIYDFKVTESMFNGSTFVWFSVFNDDVIQGRQMIPVNNDYKKLDIQFDKTAKIVPGKNSKLVIVNKSNIPDLDAMVSVYDQSLDLYASKHQDYMQMIYQNQDFSQEASIQAENLSSLLLPWTHPTLQSMLELFKTNAKHRYRPVLLIDADRLREENDYGMQLEGASREGHVMMKSMTAMAPPGAPLVSGRGVIKGEVEMDLPTTASGTSAMAQGNDSQTRAGADKERNELVTADNKMADVRRNFSETAMFEPFLKLDSNSTAVPFKAPDQLTAWKLKLLSISSDGRVGQDEQVVVSQKDLFVRVLVSRFFRENDQTEIKLKVDNLTPTPKSAKLTLDYEGVGFTAGDLFSKQVLTHAVEINGDSSYTHTWKLKIPAITGALRIKGIVVAGVETDAEEKVIPILPSRQRLIENNLVYLKEKKNNLTLKSWDKKDTTRVHELVSLQIDPQLPIMLLNSVPSLINYPYNCSEQLIHKYVPLAILHSLYLKNPKLQDAVKAAFKKTGTRKTVTLPWEDKDPRRLIELTETPWIVNSKGMTSPYDLISYLDTYTIERVKSEVFKELKSRQTGTGGFSWFSGGRDDLYITLVVLEGLSEAAAYGVDFPRDMYEKALNYVYRELPKYMKASVGELQFLIYGTYIFTAFDTNLKQLSNNKEVASAWIPFIEKHEALITPLGHAYMANIYKKLGNSKKSDASLKRALDGSIKDPLVGIYWAPEERSWLWYNDTIEKHAFFLQTLALLKPNDERIDGLAQWLLFNRKGNDWKSTKATTKAVFSLMHYLRLKTDFSQKTQLDIQWGEKKETLNIDPLSVDQKEPLRFLKTENFKKDDGHVTITKTGALPVFASMTWIYSSDEMTEASGSAVLDLKREFFLVKNQNKQQLVLLKLGDTIKVGDEIEVMLRIKSKSPLEYIHMKDPRGAGFESNSLLSGYKWESIGRYEEPRDSLMNFFFDAIPKGEYVMKHRFKATTPGVYKFNSATIQSMYAPEMAAYSSTFSLEVAEK